MSVAEGQISRQPITSSEITRCVHHLFASGAVHRDGVVAGARASGARPEVIHRLQQLPAYRYRTPQQVWEHLPKFGTG